MSTPNTAPTPGTWKRGIQSDTVISDVFPDDYEKIRALSDASYYGGYLICESIGNKIDRDLIAAAKLMYEDLVLVFNYLNEKRLSEYGKLIYEKISETIKIASGK